MKKTFHTTKFLDLNVNDIDVINWMKNFILFLKIEANNKNGSKKNKLKKFIV